MAAAKKKRPRTTRVPSSRPPVAATPPSPPPDRRHPGRQVLVLGVVLLLTAAAHAVSLGHSIQTWDDDVHLYRYRAIRALDPDHLKTIFTDRVNQTYIPLTSLSFALEYHFFQDTAWVYHLNNVLLHVVVTGLVFGLARRMGAPLPVAAMGALIFGIHPLHVESVAWATERKDVLYAFFYLLSLHQYWSYIQSLPDVNAASRRWRAYGLALMFGGLSILAKAMALSLPLVMFAIDAFARRRWSWRLVAEKVPHFVYIVPVAFMTYVGHARFPGRSAGEAVLTWIWTLVFYWRKFLWPVDLRPLYDAPSSVTWTNPHYALPVLAVAGLLFLLWRWRGDRWFVFANVYFFLSIFFLLRFDTHVDTNVVADRFMYLPSLGYGIWIAQKVWDFFQRQAGHPEVRTFVVGAGVLVFAAMGVMTFRQSRIWKDDFSLWSYLLEKDEDSYWAHFGIGQCYFEQGDPARARAHYLRTLELKPDHARALNNIGDFLYAEGKIHDAKQHFATATVADPAYAEAHNNLGVLLMGEGDAAKAREHLDIAASLKPDHPEIMMSLGDWYLRQRQPEEAAVMYERARSVAPDSPQVLNRLGVVLLETGDNTGAMLRFQEALAVDPDNPQVKNNLDVARKRLNTAR